LGLAGAVAWACACGLGAGPNDVVVAAVTVSPDSATLTADGATQQFSAVAWDSAGEPIPGALFVWTSTNRLVASVDANGLATAVSGGGTRIVADAGTASDTAILRVKLPLQSVVGAASAAAPPLARRGR
jgi:uncharacterized protein YjdB